MSAAVAAGMPRLTRQVATRRVSARRVRERPDALLWALALMHLTYVWRLPSVVKVLKPLHFAIVTGVVALALFLLDRSPRRRLINVPIAPVRLTVALLALMVMSAPGGLYPTESAMRIAQTIFPTLLLMVMLAASMRSVADIEWFAMLNMLAAAGYCLFVLWVFRVGRDGRLEELIYYDSNDFALLLVASLPSTAYFIARGHRIHRRLIALASAGLFVMLLVATGSRGGFIGLLVTTAYLALFYRGLSRTQRAVSVTVVAFAFMILGGATYFSKIETILHPAADYNWAGNSPTGRLEIWKRGVGYVADRPLLGVGVGNFLRAEGNLSNLGRELSSRGKPFKWSVAHNSYLETAVESGVLALVAFLGLFATTFVLLGRVTRRARALPFVSRELVLAQTFAAALLGYLVCAFFISAEYFAYPYVLLGLALGLAKTALPAPAAARHGR